MKKKTQKKNEMSPRKKMILDDINRTRQALEIAYIKFQYVSDPDLIDCYIYEINSADHRYKYLMNEMKQIIKSEAASAATNTGKRVRRVIRFFS